MIILRKKAAPIPSSSLIPNVIFEFVGITINQGLAANVTNGSGLTPPTPSLTGVHTLYSASNGVRSALHSNIFPRTLLFTLPNVYWVSGMAFWQATGTESGNGIQSVTLQYSLDNFSWITIPNSPSSLPLGSTTVASSSLSYLWAPIQARFIRFLVNSVWSGGRIALLEVQFSGYL